MAFKLVFLQQAV